MARAFQQVRVVNGPEDGQLVVFLTMPDHNERRPFKDWLALAKYMEKDA